MKSLFFAVTLIASTSVFAMQMTHYTCMDEKNQWQVQADLSDRRTEIGSFKATYDGWSIINTNVDKSDILILGMQYDIDFDVKFTVQMSGDVFLFAKGKSVKLNCEIKTQDETPAHCERKGCGPNGARYYQQEVPPGYQCIPVNVMCKV